MTGLPNMPREQRLPLLCFLPFCVCHWPVRKEVASCLFWLLLLDRGSQLVWVNNILSYLNPRFRVLGSREAYKIFLNFLSMLAWFISDFFYDVVLFSCLDLGQGATFINHLEDIVTNCSVNTNHGNFCTLERLLPLYWCQEISMWTWLDLWLGSYWRKSLS